MNLDRIEEILGKALGSRILAAGDFFLDLYWSIDPALEETSIETGRPAHQIVARRPAPGAAGTIVNNLASLGVGSIQVVGLIGEDPSGWELRRLLDRRGIDTSGLVSAENRSTPVYIKPMVRGPAGEVEGDRFDIKNRTPTPRHLEELVIERFEAGWQRADAAVVLDQVQEAGCGTVTERVRESIQELASRHPDKPILADSRCRIAHFRRVMLKPNLEEAAEATGNLGTDPAQVVAARLYERAGRPVFVTLGAGGLLLHNSHGSTMFPALPAGGPIDPVGAGDSMSAGIISALAAGASESEAAQIGLLAAAVTIRKVGTTGTASASEILERASKHLEIVSRW